jgi:hypothetical protein
MNSSQMTEEQRIKHLLGDLTCEQIAQHLGCALERVETVARQTELTAALDEEEAALVEEGVARLQAALKDRRYTLETIERYLAADRRRLEARRWVTDKSEPERRITREMELVTESYRLVLLAESGKQARDGCVERSV